MDFMDGFSNSSDEYMVPDLVGSEESSEPDAEEDVERGEEEENEEVLYTMMLTHHLREAIENLHMYIVRQKRIYRDVINYMLSTNQNVEKELEYELDLEYQANRCTDLYHTIEVREGVRVRHSLELTVDDCFSKDHTISCITQEELMELRRVNAYCTEHHKCFCYCSEPPMLI